MTRNITLKIQPKFYGTSWSQALMHLSRLLCTNTKRKRLSGIYTHASFIADSTLWPDTCNDFYLTFQAFVKMCLSYWMILLTLKYIQDFLMCSAGRIPFACYQQMIMYYKLNSVLLHGANICNPES